MNHELRTLHRNNLAIRAAGDVARVETEEEMLVFNDKNPWPKDAVAPDTPLPF